ncbi:ImmA/IrrE family metallo-endopeptidase, partial [Dickeya oryzae]|uniref:ImmA/IrrE family metallo-endopeptidase n=1 Tax=Dickeya oryzae TaxID=1240404 RepID=UPI0020981BC6
AAHVLGKQEPKDYADLLRQRVETNYLAGALLIPESSAVSFLQAAKEARELSVEDLRDAFAVTYETAAHRFTNLATKHLGIPVHFLK